MATALTNKTALAGFLAVAVRRIVEVEDDGFMAVTFTRRSSIVKPWAFSAGLDWYTKLMTERVEISAASLIARLAALVLETGPTSVFVPGAKLGREVARSVELTV